MAASSCGTPPDRMEEPGELKVSVDVLLAVGIAHISLFRTWRGHGADKIEVDLTEQCIKLRLLQDNSAPQIETATAEVCLVSDSIGFLPHSCSGLTGRVLSNAARTVHEGTGDNQHELTRSCVDGRRYAELGFRVQCPMMHVECFQDELVLPPVSSTRDILNIDEESPQFIMCAHCKHRLRESPCCFTKILDLPSGGWNEVTGDLFCHKHHHHCRNAAADPEGDAPHVENQIGGMFIPPEDHLYASELHLHLNPNVVDQNCIRDQTVHCTRCLALLGEYRVMDEKQPDKSGIIMLYKHKVTFSGEKSCTSKASEEHLGAKMVVDLVKTNHSLTLVSKIYLEAKNSGGIVLLLWVMDQNLKHFHTTIPDSSFAKKASIPIQFKSVMKVLYGTAASNSQLAQQWRHDFAVEVYTIDEETLLSLIDILNRSTETILPSERIIDDLRVGYLSSECIF